MITPDEIEEFNLMKSWCIIEEASLLMKKWEYVKKVADAALGQSKYDEDGVGWSMHNEDGGVSWPILFSFQELSDNCDTNEDIQNQENAINTLIITMIE